MFLLNFYLKISVVFNLSDVFFTLFRFISNLIFLYLHLYSFLDFSSAMIYTVDILIDLIQRSVTYAAETFFRRIFQLPDLVGDEQPLLPVRLF